MTWLSDMPGMGAAQDRATKAMRFPMGAASPLWMAFGAAASAGVAWWWMTRLARPVNLEALLAKPAAAAEPVADMVAVAVEPVVEALAEPVIEAVATLEPETPAPVEAAPVEAVAAPDPELEPAPAPPLTPDDLTRIVGIGPKLAASLAERGVTTFMQLAAWTAEDLAAADAALSLKGRAVRDAWIAQAKRFAAA